MPMGSSRRGGRARSISRSPWTCWPTRHRRRRQPAGKCRPPAPDPAAIEAAARLVGAARLLVVIAGGGTLEAGPALQRFVETSGAALIPTAAAKGNVSDDHPQSLGSTLSLAATRELLAAADVVLAVGTELAETDHWTDRLPIEGKLVRIDIDPRTLMRDYKPDVAILADAGAALSLLNLKIAARPADLDRIGKVRAANAGSWRSLAKKHAKVLDALREVLPDDGIVVSDMTQIAYTGNVQFACRRPRGWFHPQGFGTLGYALPRLSAPSSQHRARRDGRGGRRSLPFRRAGTRDRRRARAAPAILLWNNDALGQIAGDMKDAASRRSPSSRAIPIFRPSPGLPLPRLPAGEPRGA